MKEDGALEIGDVVVINHEHHVVESVDYKWEKDAIWGHWITVKKLRKDGGYNSRGAVIEFFQSWYENMKPVDKMSRLFVWPKSKNPIDKPMNLDTIGFCGETVAISGA